MNKYRIEESIQKDGNSNFRIQYYEPIFNKYVWLDNNFYDTLEEAKQEARDIISRSTKLVKHHDIE